MGLRMGFTSSDLKRMSVGTLINFVDEYCESNGSGRRKDESDGGVRKATQSDIDRIFG